MWAVAHIFDNVDADEPHLDKVLAPSVRPSILD